MRRVGALMVWLLGLMLVVTPCGAQGDDEASAPENVEAARVLAKQGLAAVKDGRFDEAIPILSRSLRLHHAAFTLYTLGLAYKGAKRPAAALESFRQFLALPSSEAMKDYEGPARDAVAELEAEVAHVTITLDPPGIAAAKVTIDGEEIPSAALGLPRLVDPGHRVIAAAAPGYLDARREIDIAAQQTTDVTLSLAPDPADSTPADTPPEETSMVAAQVVLIGVGTLALGAGITVGVLGYQQAKRAQFSNDDDANAAKTKSLVGDVLAVSGGVVAGAGLVWLLVDALGADDESEALALRPYGDGATAGVRLSF